MTFPYKNEGISVAQEQTDAREGIKNARSFFEKQGFIIEDSGFLSRNLTPEEIDSLRTWHETTTVDSIQMVTQEDFYRKVFIVVSLWRQKDSSGAKYLLGKGVGTEIALQGIVRGRERNAVRFPYRPHSDFELYGINDRSEQALFSEVFPGEEGFSSESRRTKGLVNLPPDLLNQTFETVELGDMEVLIPELELLFLDKYAKPEQTPRSEGYDAELIARQYELDREKLHMYAEAYVIQPEIQDIEEDFKDKVEEQKQAILDHIRFSIDKISAGDQELSVSNIVNDLNSTIQSNIRVYKSNLEDVSMSGLEIYLWEDIQPEQIDIEGNIIDPLFLTRLKEKVENSKSKKIQDCKNLHAHIDELLDKCSN